MVQHRKPGPCAGFFLIVRRTLVNPVNYLINRTVIQFRFLVRHCNVAGRMSDISCQRPVSRVRLEITITVKEYSSAAAGTAVSVTTIAIVLQYRNYVSRIFHIHCIACGGRRRRLIGCGFAARNNANSRKNQACQYQMKLCFHNDNFYFLPAT
jgi:hypothetical protein